MFNMRRLITTMLVVLAGAGVLPFVLPLKDGKPLMSFSDIDVPSMPDVGALVDNVELPGGGDDSAPKVTLYQWRDANGQIQFGDKPPAGATDIRSRVVDTGANVVQSYRAPAPKGTQPDNGEMPRNAREAAEKARSAGDALQARKRVQDARIDGR